MHPDDTVAIALQPHASGEIVRGQIRSRNDVPKGHKIAVSDIEKGEPVRKYGHVIGTATADIRTGELVHTHNLAYTTDMSGTAMPTSDTVIGRQAIPSDELSFLGYRRPNGGVGTRNYIGVMATVNCSATVVSRIARHFEGSIDVTGSSIDSVVAVTHQSGCGIPAGGAEISMLHRVLRGYIGHPNFGGWLIVGLGCEVNQISDLIGSESISQVPIRKLCIQEEGGTRAAIETGIGLVSELVAATAGIPRTPTALSELSVGLQCGGSDGWSGITANPALGNAVDRLIAGGGAAILAETPEIHGAEELLKRRAASSDVAGQLQAKVDWWQNYLAEHNQDLSANPSPGNLAGGITTILEKSLGAVAKSGSSPLCGVLDYAETLRESGLWFMDSPGYDPCSVTGEVAAGANLICFTTGRGSVFGAAGAPTIKIASNSELFERMRDDMDIDCGGIVHGSDSIEAAGDRILRSIIDIASGKRTNSETHGLGTFEFVPWSPGAVV